MTSRAVLDVAVVDDAAVVNAACRLGCSRMSLTASKVTSADDEVSTAVNVEVLCRETK